MVVSIKPHKQFQRKGSDLYLDASIGIGQAALGVEMEVPTLDGTATLKVPEGTQHGTLFRIRGRGMPHLHGSGKGDLKVRVGIKVPKKLNQKQKELLHEYSKLSGEEAGVESKNFFDHLKEAFGSG